ncbi:efflux transporter outer membrane subunit [Asticcacaulis sp. W401b]|uniref:efflux transporter outer membrane subunit n=1 Tax=Asticcacaulis sp. W401b TaxID=3388666 RepID=UPI003970A1A6
MKSLAPLLLLLTGCATTPHTPTPSITPTLPEAWHSAAPQALPDTAWWRGFNDPVLASLVEKALTANTDIAIAASRVEDARAQLHIANAQTLPLINMGLTGAHQRDLNAFGVPVTQDAGRALATMSYDTDLFGRLSNTKGAARANLLASQAAQDSVRLATATTTATAYINLLAADARLKILTETLAARQSALQLARRRADAGYAARLEVNQAQAEYEAAAQLIPTVRLSIRRYENALSLLLGEAPATIARGDGLLSLHVPAPTTIMPSELLRHRPDIFEAEQGVAAADRNLGAARAALMPNLQLTLSGGRANSSLLSSGVDVFSLGGSLVAPLFSGGRLEGQVDAATARREQAVLGYRKTVLTALRDVEDALAAGEELKASEAAIEQQGQALAISLKLARGRYEAGYAPYLEQLDAQRSALAAELALIQSRTDRLNAAVTLFQALGGGWSEPTDSVERK